MKQVIQNFKTGELTVEEVPVPTLREGGVLVRNRYSLISTGTEAGTVKLARKNMLAKARARPDLARKVIEVAKRDGLLTAYQQAMRRLDSPVRLGYSCAGTVLEVGQGVDDIKVGDRLACGGGGYANHAEVVFVPRNLCVKLPESVDFRSGAFVTVGAIALQSVRIADVRLGEVVVVIGLGLVGLLVVQCLKAAGCKVVGIDLDVEKVELALGLGADCALARDAPNLEGKVAEATNCIGADAVIITAATSSNDPIELAGKLARYKGRVVVVGKVGMAVPRQLYLYKELELFTSLSYGPGRHDRIYEEKGIDYPVGYVRWTENRNMAAFAELLGTGRVCVKKMITHEFAVEDAQRTYEIITGEGQRRHIGVLLRYEPDRAVSDTVRFRRNERRARKAIKGEVNVGVIGAGNFAVGVLLPNLSKVRGAHLKAIASATGVSAKAVGEKYGFEYCTSDYQRILDDPDIDCVMIMTRNNLHAPLVVQALESGKDVFVEKPLAISLEQLRAVVDVWKRTSGRAMVGFNRRFSPFAIKLKEFFANRSQPMVATYRVNAGFIPRDHWVHDPEVGGGRIIAEVCHFIDFIYFLTDSRGTRVYAQSISEQRHDIVNADNVLVNLEFEDGSIGSVAYVSNGDRSFSKERIEVFCDNAVGVLDDFHSLHLVRDGKSETRRSWLTQDKGHVTEVVTFIKALQDGMDLATDFRTAVHSTLCTLQALVSLACKLPIAVDWSQLSAESQLSQE